MTQSHLHFNFYFHIMRPPAQNALYHQFCLMQSGDEELKWEWKNSDIFKNLAVNHTWIPSKAEFIGPKILLVTVQMFLLKFIIIFQQQDNTF